MTKTKAATAAAIGLRIKEAREECGQTQAQLGDAIGVTYQMIWKYEQGKGSVTAEKIGQIANALKKPPAFFYG